MAKKYNHIYSDAYNNGKMYIRKNEDLNARKCFEMAANSFKFRNNALWQIINLDIREGKYHHARKLLEENYAEYPSSFSKAYGLLENIENNFEASKSYYAPKIQNIKYRNDNLIGMAKLYIQLGDYQDARAIFEFLLSEESYVIQVSIDLVCLNILEQNYEQAFTILNGIDKQKLSEKLLQHYKSLNRYLLYLLGKRRNPSGSKEGLLQHLKIHKDQRNKATKGCFFEDIDLQKLVNEARERIEGLNPNHFEVSDMYRFHMDQPIGFKGEETTNDLCVVTYLESKDIITMYPVKLSDKFDREGMSTSEELKRKRQKAISER